MELKKGFAAREFVVSVQLDQPEYSATDKLLKIAKKLKKYEISVVDINSTGRYLRQDSLWIAAALQKLGMETIPHITPRDSFVEGILSQVLGSFNVGGVKNFLVVHGDPRESREKEIWQSKKGVYETDSIGLIAALDRLRQKHVLDFLIGCAFSQTAENLNFELRRLSKKIEVGADFIMTQPIFTYSDWERVAESVLSLKKPTLVGIWPIFEIRKAERILEDKIAGVKMSLGIFQKMEERMKISGEKGLADFSIAHSLDLIRYLKSSKKAHGVYIIAPFRNALASPIWKLLRSLRDL